MIRPRDQYPAPTSMARETKTSKKDRRRDPRDSGGLGASRSVVSSSRYFRRELERRPIGTERKGERSPTSRSKANDRRNEKVKY